MIDSEKVSKGLKLCVVTGDFCGECPYDGMESCIEKLHDDALVLLKEQEAKTGHWIFESQYCEAWSHKCSECEKRTTTAVNTFANWCWNCGAKMTDRR